MHIITPTVRPSSTGVRRKLADLKSFASLKYSPRSDEITRHRFFIVDDYNFSYKSDENERDLFTELFYDTKSYDLMTEGYWLCKRRKHWKLKMKVGKSHPLALLMSQIH